MRKLPKCPQCGNTAEWFGQKIHCRVCKKYHDHPNAPRVLFLDIETSRVKVDLNVWSSDIKHRQTRVTPDDITGDWFMLSWAACWAFGETFGTIVTPQEAKKRNDKRIVKELHAVMKLADFIVTYNGNKFDLKRINWRFMFYQLKPIPYYASLDVMKKLQDVADPTSKSLDFVAIQLGYGGKVENPPGLWDMVESGDKESLDHMLKYNKVDVDKTHDVYFHTKPYWKVHPNFGAFLDMYQSVDKTLDVGKNNHRCPRCMNGVISDEKFTKQRQTPTGYFYKTANCPHCGAVIYKVHKDNQFSKNSQKVFVR